MTKSSQVLSVQAFSGRAGPGLPWDSTTSGAWWQVYTTLEGRGHHWVSLPRTLETSFYPHLLLPPPTHKGMESSQTVSKIWCRHIF